ncbi:MAG: PD-(D/E)XK nuclease family protein [Clostridia bacterium]|nr:PD-(D/E)XK nuclease family protein [Clostridia bacterium]
MTNVSVGLECGDGAALREGAPYSGDKLYKPELYLLSTTAEDEAVDPEIEELKDAELEAILAVKIINEYHNKPIYDSKKGEERPLEYKDMVILLRATKGKGEVYYRALEDAGIPVYLERGEGYFDTPEIQVLLNLLRIIDNFRQDVPLISVLHFPSFGFTADELARIRVYSKQKELKNSYSEAFAFYASDADGPLKDRCVAFLKNMDLLRQKSKAMPLADFIWDVLCESGIGDFARALPMGVQRYANLRALADKAESFEAQNGGGLYGFINYIEAISSGDKAVETGQVTVLAEGADTVRIMTIHKSKGLEFPFVLLAGLGSKFMGQQNRLHLAYHKDFGAAVRLVEPLKGLYTDPLSLALINEKKSLEEYAEVIRILYVAMTRAKDILVMSAAVKDAYEWNVQRPYLSETKKCKNYLEMIGPSLKGSDIQIVSLTDLGMVKQPQEYAKVVLDALDKGFDVNPEDLPISEDELKERIFYDYSSKDGENLKHKYSVSEIAELTREGYKKEDSPKLYEESFAVPLFVSGKLPLNAAAKGTAYHKIMEHIPFTLDGKTPEDVMAFIASLRERNLLTEDEAAVVEAERISAFFESEIGKRACASKELYKEKPFVLKTTFEGREIIVQGTIDCFFEEDGQYVLVDYKSNYINKESLESEKQRMTDEYVPQLALYKEALEKLTGKTVKEAVLYLFGINDN